MITIDNNDDEKVQIELEVEENDYKSNNINTTSDKINTEQAKEKVNQGKEKVGKALKNKKVIIFIASHIVPILIILAIIIFIIILIGQYSFLTTMPGLVLENIKNFGYNVWTRFMSDLNGFFTGDSITTTITEEDVLNLAQYLQNMGYDIEGCGFGKEEYETKGGADKYKTKQLTKVTGLPNENGGDEKEYLKAYIASNEATYVLSNYSLNGFLKQIGSEVVAFVKLDPSQITTNQEFSTGMINILDTSPVAPSERFIRIDREHEKMTVYTNAVYLPIIGVFTDWLGLTENGSIQWGSTFSYDMSTWTAKYGKPVELFLSVHLSTMMPDLAYRIAKDQDLNTKVNIVLQDITVKYDTSVKSIGGNESHITGEDVVNNFLEYCLTGDKVKYTEEDEEDNEENSEDEEDSENDEDEEEEEDETESEPEEKEIDFYREILNSLGNDQEEKNKFFRNIIKQIKDNWQPDVFGINIANALINEDEGFGLGRFLRRLGNHFFSLAERLFTGDSKYIVYVKRGSEQVPGLDGLTYDDLVELSDIVAQGLEDGVSGVKWPYIQSVTNHWYYDDIDFSVGVYRKAASAKKKIQYRPADEENSFLNKHDIEVELDATLTADEGIVYQVCEPEATGPNQHIIDIFSDKYYKYDGTIQTAKKIENAKLYDGNGGATGSIEDNTAVKQEVSFEDNKTNALAAFSILENMHSEEAEFAYRNLKDLVVTLKYFKKSELTEDLQNAMLWLISTDDKEEEFNVTKDENEYGIVIKDVENRTIIAPENCEISTEGGVATLKFTKMSASTIELLKYIYEKDYKNINPDILVGLTMKIKGINNLTTGSVQRGATIGQASDELEIVMFDIDKSIVDNIEEYMIPEHNNAYEGMMRDKMNKVYEEGIDIGRVYGDGFFRASKKDEDNGSSGNKENSGSSDNSESNENDNKGTSSGSSAVTTGHGKWRYSDSDLDLLCAITAAEDQGSYEGALAVISTACNRTESSKWSKRGSDPLSQYMSKGQFAGYYNGNYKKWLNGKYPSYVRQAVMDALDGKRNHNYGSFRANYNDGREQIGDGGNWYFDVVV